VAGRRRRRGQDGPRICDGGSAGKAVTTPCHGAGAVLSFSRHTGTSRGGQMDTTSLANTAQTRMEHARSAAHGRSAQTVHAGRDRPARALVRLDVRAGRGRGRDAARSRSGRGACGGGCGAVPAGLLRHPVGLDERYLVASSYNTDDVPYRLSPCCNRQTQPGRRATLRV
jgi:hypothetical protein